MAIWAPSGQSWLTYTVFKVSSEDANYPVGELLNPGKFYLTLKILLLKVGRVRDSVVILKQFLFSFHQVWEFEWCKCWFIITRFLKWSRCILSIQQEIKCFPLEVLTWKTIMKLNLKLENSSLFILIPNAGTWNWLSLKIIRILSTYLTKSEYYLLTVLENLDLK